MLDMNITLELLFEQLGLEADQASIDAFIEAHQLDQDTALHQADFWTESQKNFFISHWKKDDEWSLIVDELNALLHSNDGTHNTN